MSALIVCAAALFFAGVFAWALREIDRRDPGSLTGRRWR